MTDLHYEHPKLVDVYDLGNAWSEDRNFYLSLAGDKPISILDLGCGTGLLCNAYAERGHMVTGADPAASMLEAARKSRFGKKIEWVQASAEFFQFDTKFDLIVMTGHAFQVLLDDHNVASSFVRIRDHLSREGMFAPVTGTGQLSGAAIDLVLSRKSVSISGCYMVALYQNSPEQ